MIWKHRYFQMLMIVVVYLFVIRPNTSGMVQGISDLMVGIGVLLFGIGSIIRVWPAR